MHLLDVVSLKCSTGLFANRLFLGLFQSFLVCFAYFGRIEPKYIFVKFNLYLMKNLENWYVVEGLS